MNNITRILLFVSLACLTAIPTSLFSQRVALDRIVAVVGKECVLQSDLDAQTEFYAFNSHVDPATPGLKEQLLDEMINQKLMLARAIEDTLVNVREEDVTAQLDALIAQRIQQAGSEKKLEEVYNMPISKMKREFRDETRKQLLVQTLQQLKFGDIQATKREVEEFYTTYKDSLPVVPEEMDLYHIFRLPKKSDASKNLVRAKAQRILDSIKAGGDFALYARKYSDDPGTQTFGGDLGFARRGQFFKEFEEALFALKDSEYAQIVETPIGYHIMQLIERRGESVHARHILFKVSLDPAEAESTKVFLRGLKDSVLHGENFSDLARKYSEDKESAPLGGSLGRFTITQFDKSLLATVKDLKIGEISEPAEVDYSTTKGYHIVYVKDRVPEHKMTLNDDWKRLEQLATGNKRNLEYQKWLKGLRTEIYWEKKL